MRHQGHFEEKDIFQLIRTKAVQMVLDGEMTQEEASEWIKQEDAKEYASVSAEAPPEQPQRVNFPDQGHSTKYGYKETDGTITPQPEKHLTEWNEHD
mgnify:CR=1 FL=1